MRSIFAAHLFVVDILYGRSATTVRQTVSYSTRYSVAIVRVYSNICNANVVAQGLRQVAKVVAQGLRQTGVVQGLHLEAVVVAQDVRQQEEGVVWFLE